MLLSKGHHPYLAKKRKKKTIVTTLGWEWLEVIREGLFRCGLGGLEGKREVVEALGQVSLTDLKLHWVKIWD